MDSWEDDNFEPQDASGTIPNTDKWEGEDEDDDVKDSWDADDDDKSSPNSDTPKATQRKKKKKLADIIAEKEAAREAEFEAKMKDREASNSMSTPEGKLAEKLRLQKLEENSNLQLAKDMLGLRGDSSGIDGMSPTNKDEFEKFEKALSNKIVAFSSSDHYPDFVETLVRNICLDLNASSLKKVKMNIEALHSTKLKEEKAAQAKAKKKTKGGSIRMDTNKEYYSRGADYDDMDDFM